MSKYLEFIPTINGATVLSKKQKAPLGEITFYGSWKQYVFEPISNAIFNNECLQDIIWHINFLNKKRVA